MPVVEVDVKKLLEAGAHFGHKTSRWHPKMRPFIYDSRVGSHIIDLTKTAEQLEKGLDFLAKTTAAGKQILFVGTKRQAKDIIKQAGEATNMPYVNERWLGGMLTNQKTIGARIKYLKDLESRMESGALAAKYNKLEIQKFQEEINAMNFLYGGVKNLVNKLGAIFVVDILKETNAIKEARKLSVPIVAIVDTNADPSLVDYPIPCNDDAIKTIQLITDYVREAIQFGKTKAAKAEAVDKKEVKSNKEQGNQE